MASRDWRESASDLCCSSKGTSRKQFMHNARMLWSPRFRAGVILNVSVSNSGIQVKLVTPQEGSRFSIVAVSPDK
jgi:hypothetical protein